MSKRWEEFGKHEINSPDFDRSELPDSLGGGDYDSQKYSYQPTR